MKHAIRFLLNCTILIVGAYRGCFQANAAEIKPRRSIQVLESIERLLETQERRTKHDRDLARKWNQCHAECIKAWPYVYGDQDNKDAINSKRDECLKPCDVWINPELGEGC